MKYNQLII